MRRRHRAAIVRPVMIKWLAVTVLMVVAASIATLGAQEIELDSPVNFSITLRELSRMAERGSDSSEVFESYVVVQGYISASTVITRTEEHFRASVDLVSGEWEGLENVRTHQSRFIVEGDEYRDRIFERPPRRPADDDIIPGREAVVIARLLRYEEDQLSGRRIPVLEVRAFRIAD